MILILGKGISAKGVRRMAEYLKIQYDYLDPFEVKMYHYDYIVKSPGISYDELVVVEAIKRKVSIISDIEFAYMHFRKKNYVMVTGTNGKTTTTTLLGSILGGITCGNIGYSIGDAIMDNLKNDTFICELSSFQLEGTKTFRPKIACVLNLGSAHLDHHKTMDEYHKAKLKCLSNQNKGDALIFNYDDCMISVNNQAKKISFSLFKKKANCYFYNNAIYYNGELIIKTKNIKIKGKYNLYNIMASICIAKTLRVKNKRIKKAIKCFKGVSFRNEQIKKNVFNDAKSTNPLSTLAALTEQDRCVLICGGKPRGENLSVLDSQLSKVKKVYCYGEGKDIIKDYMKLKKVDVETFETLKEAVMKVKKDRVRINILFSPLMASFDQYKNYIERGLEFNRYYGD